ncbi:hypothetical protein [Geitlerinema sp. PCC 7407]|uniref:hypothetical protein n=1 Tax=Geitlerinema sp. PCC 7407 TaxID=1173025 RepID=UPI00029FCCAA|nr:hypothetical protein [Geitlerinema sp. PCC 7407]AFY67635.1 hypothetical protein GEI7407_3167 [Geitlerinema sp. PCC 7407]
MRLKAFAALVVAGVLWLATAVWTPPAWALTPIELRDITYGPCPTEVGEGAVTSGGMSLDANCFLVTGKAVNKSGKTLVNADIFGRIYDANNNPILQNRTRLGSIDEVPPGESDFELRISVPANQPTPLQLKQFKASGFTGTVRRY